MRIEAVPIEQLSDVELQGAAIDLALAMDSIQAALSEERPDLVQRYSTYELAIHSLLSARHKHRIDPNWLDPLPLKDTDSGSFVGMETLQGNRICRLPVQGRPKIRATAAYYWTANTVGDEEHYQIAEELVKRGQKQSPVVITVLSERQQRVARGLIRVLPAIGNPVPFMDLQTFAGGFENVGYIMSDVQLYATGWPDAKLGSAV